jgi:hypothetical protein
MLVELLAGLFSHSADSLLALFQEDGQSDYYTWFMRLLTAGNATFHSQIIVLCLSLLTHYHVSYLQCAHNRVC